MAQLPVVKRNGLPIRSLIFRCLYESETPCSKQTLTNACGVSMPTLYQGLNELLEEGLICYSGLEQSTGGRRAQGLTIVPDARVSIGIALSDQHLRMVAADLRLGELAYRSEQFDTLSFLSEGGPALAEILESFLEEAGLDREKILGVGVTVPGLLTPDHSRVLFAPTLGMRDMPLRTLAENIPYPVHVENDGSASGYADGFVRGGKRNLAYISLEYGVGGAVLMAGEPYAGNNARSGEFGHICVEPGGRLCSCGKRGCLEAYCSLRRIEETLGVGLEEFFRGVSEHIPEYEHLLYDMLRHLAVAISSVRMTLDCDVVLGGAFSEYLGPFLPILKQYVQAGDPFSENAEYLQLSAVRHHITPLGAALYFIREFISSV